MNVDAPRPKLDKCRSCGAPMLWATHMTTGKRAPFDATPLPHGTYVFAMGLQSKPRRCTLTAHFRCWRCDHRVDDHGPHGAGCTITLNNSSVCPCTDCGLRYLPHHATCPEANQWRAGEKPGDANVDFRTR